MPVDFLYIILIYLLIGGFLAEALKLAYQNKGEVINGALFFIIPFCWPLFIIGTFLYVVVGAFRK